MLGFGMHLERPVIKVSYQHAICYQNYVQSDFIKSLTWFHEKMLSKNASFQHENNI